MARDVESLPPDDKIRRQVGRTVMNLFTIGLSLAILGAWSWFGLYQLDPGQDAVILRFGSFSRIVDTPGLKWHLPPPLESHDLVSVASIEKESFGYRTENEDDPLRKLEGTVQTRDNNIVHIGFVVQYNVKNAFYSRYRIADAQRTLRDTAEAAMREVIGRTPIDGVLSKQRGEVEQQTAALLQSLLDGYESGLRIEGVQLLDAQAPPDVRAAFDDVVAADQDRDRAVNEAQGYANEVIPKARAEAVELRQSATGFRDARIAEATGDAGRFTALLIEYQKAPEVTRERLYLETMEQVMPGVEKVIIEPGTSPVLPYLPIGRAGRAGREGRPAAPRASGTEGGAR